MKCIKKIMKRFGYYYYYQEVQAVKMNIDEAGEYYLLVNHFSKSAQIISQKDINKRQHKDKKQG